ncbi:DUF6541 family protein [Arthrobacter sp. VKM Ac-2550]|uniref:DUF6541 family protein n=1 Tax=Crystallibacter permensis TaxID=1938888 RepID=UPI00224182FF|nr:DUF6541 family protein [Arthrobacter sp. VKM Ac-2550]MCW2131873.1 hypothetical protein [Arthrobacter sp. VKM Ac-2550]
MSWVAIGQLAALLAVFYFPGYMVLRGLRLNHLRALVVAPGVSGSLVAAGTLLCRITGIRWGPSMLLAVSLLAAVLAACLYLLIRPKRMPPEPGHPGPTKLLIAGSLIAAAVLNGWTMLDAMNNVDRVNQAWDPSFHVNALRWIKENGQASPWDINPIYSQGTGSFYPAGWHALVALPPGDVVTSANLATLIVACVVWPTSLTYLAVALFPQRRLTWVLTPAVAAGVIAFPIIQQSRSAQWPNALAVALVPAILALGIELAASLHQQHTDPPEDVRPTRPDGRNKTVKSLVLVLATAGAAWIHPSAIFALIALGGIYVLRYIVLMCRASWLQDRRHGLLWVAFWALSTGSAVWLISTSPIVAGMADNTAVTASFPDAAERLFFDLPRSPDNERIQLSDYNFWIGPLVILGAFCAQRRKRSWPAAVGLGITVVLYLAALHPARLLSWMTGLWYHDAVRIAAVSAVVACVFAAYALDQIFTALIRYVPVKGRRAAVAAIVAATACTVVASGAFRYDTRQEAAAPHYDVESDEFGRSILSGEQDFIESLADVLPADATVIGDPFNGSTFIYALTGRHVVYSQYGFADRTADEKFLRTRFRDIHRDPEVCAALRRTGAEYVYLGGAERARQFNPYLQWPGFYDVDVSQGFELLAAAEHAALYKITACNRRSMKQHIGFRHITS